MAEPWFCFCVEWLSIYIVEWLSVYVEWLSIYIEWQIPISIFVLNG
jgi:hypothetical protein